MDLENNAEIKYLALQKAHVQVAAVIISLARNAEYHQSLIGSPY